MNRSQYMNALSKKLSKLPKDEFDRAMEYFTEYFEEAGPEGEEEAISSLGAPEEASEEIIRNIAIRRLDHPEKGTKKRLSTIWIVLLSTLASPFTFILGCFLLVGVGSGGVLLMAVGLFFALLVLAEIAAVGIGIWFLTFSPASGMVMLGGGLAALGLEWLILTGVKKLCSVFRGQLRSLIAKKRGVRYGK